MEPVKVLVHAFDEVSLAGTLAILRRVPQLRPYSGSDEIAGVPDVLVAVDEHAASNESFAFLRDLHERYSGQAPLRCVLVAEEFRAEDTLAAVERGVFAFVYRSEVTGPSLVATVLAVARGSAFVPEDLQGVLLSQVNQLRRQVLEPEGITLFGFGVRERAVLKLLADGHDTDEIARRLECSEGTVKNVLYGFMARQGLTSRSHAVAHALRAGVI